MNKKEKKKKKNIKSAFFGFKKKKVGKKSVGGGGGWGSTKSTRGISSQVKKSSYKKGEDWFEPFLSIHTPLSPTLPSVFLFAPLHLSSQKNYS